MNRPDTLTISKLQDAKAKMILAARQEYKSNGFVLFAGQRFGKSELHKIVTAEEVQFKEMIKKIV